MRKTIGWMIAGAACLAAATARAQAPAPAGLLNVVDGNGQVIGQTLGVGEANVAWQTAQGLVTISVTRDAEGEVVEGDPKKVREVTDIWTFARDISSKNPNWKLVATESAN